MGLHGRRAFTGAHAAAVIPQRPDVGHARNACSGDTDAHLAALTSPFTLATCCRLSGGKSFYTFYIHPACLMTMMLCIAPQGACACKGLCAPACMLTLAVFQVLIVVLLFDSL